MNPLSQKGWCEANDGGVMPLSSEKVGVRPRLWCDAMVTWEVGVKPNRWCDAILYGVSVKLTSTV